METVRFFLLTCFSGPPFCTTLDWKSDLCSASLPFLIPGSGTEERSPGNVVVWRLLSGSDGEESPSVAPSWRGGGIHFPFFICKKAKSCFFWRGGGGEYYRYVNFVMGGVYFWPSEGGGGWSPPGEVRMDGSVHKVPTANERKNEYLQ